MTTDRAIAFDPEPLACPVRDCAERLELAGRALRCARGHCFDLAREGYANLLQPQDRRSREPGDAREAVLARERVLARGLGMPLLEELAQLARELEGPAPRALELGCGTGWFLGELAARRPLRGTGIDLARLAVERAARSYPAHTWIVANADRPLPLREGAFELALSITGPKPPAELARVLARSGRLALALPAADDLIELRAAVTGEGRELERAPRTLELLAPHFELLRRRTVRSTLELPPELLRDLLASTYRTGRAAREARARELGTLSVTLAYELLWLRPLPSG